VPKSAAQAAAPLPTASLQPLHLHIYWAVTVASQVKHRVRSTHPLSAVAASGHRATIGRKASGWLIALARRAAAEAAAITRNVAGWRALAEAEYERAGGAAQPESWSEAATAWEQPQRHDGRQAGSSSDQRQPRSAPAKVGYHPRRQCRPWVC
jgi:hypothetical protein